MGVDPHKLWDSVRLEHLERESFCHAIPSGKESAERAEDIGELRQVHLITPPLTVEGGVGVSYTDPLTLALSHQGRGNSFGCLRSDP